MRKTKVIGFSIPPEIYSQFESILKKGHKTKSEFFREILDAYFRGATHCPAAVGEKDIARALRNYWEFKSLPELEVMVIGLAIIEKNGKILIGQRVAKDPWVENLSWVFPGGKMDTLHFGNELKKIVKSETGLDVDVKTLVTSRIHPDSGFKNIQIIALYFYCQANPNAKEIAGKTLKKLKWVKPSDVFKYFTTSVSDETTKFLMMLEKERGQK